MHHIGMEEVGWWGDPQRWDYRQPPCTTLAWRRLGGGETPGGGITVISAQLQLQKAFFFFAKLIPVWPGLRRPVRPRSSGESRKGSDVSQNLFSE